MKNWHFAALMSNMWLIATMTTNGSNADRWFFFALSIIWLILMTLNYFAERD
jgi:hypothetical protein